MIIQPGHALDVPFGEIHHIYANAKAMSGLNGSQYADGAVFVFDLLDYDIISSVIVETERKRIDVMQFDIERFADTGGWGFASIVGDSRTDRVEQDVVTACYNGHETAKETGYIYSQYRP